MIISMKVESFNKLRNILCVFK